MKIIVTGATGFLGQSLCSQLKASGHLVVELNSKNCDLTQAESLMAFNQRDYDQIFHLAAWTQAGDFCLKHPGEQWIINQQINTNVLSWWQSYQPQAKLISIGTSCSYAPDLELVEENYLLGMPIDSLFTYAMTKRMLYAGLLAVHKQFDLNYLHVVPSTLYGPGYHTDGRQMHFIFDLIRKIIEGKLYARPVILWGDGYQKRELVYIDDFVRILTHLSESRQNELVNIGAGREHTIRHFAQLISEEVGFDHNVVHYDTSRYVGARSKCLDTRKLRKMVSDLQLTPLETGLSTTIKWFQSNWEFIQSRELNRGVSP